MTRLLRLRAWLQTYWPYLALAIAVMAPLLRPGYILTLDAVFVPRIPAPQTLTSDYAWQWALHLLNFVVPSQAIEKGIFVGILLGSAIGAHRLFRGLAEAAHWPPEWQKASYVAGVLYMSNPFTYDRFMAGQYGVLLGYALLPWIVQAWLALAERPGRRQSVQVLGLLLLVSIVSLPSVGLAALAGGSVLSVAAWHRRWPAFKSLVRAVASVAVAFVALSSYWLVPAALGKGPIAQQVQGFTVQHTAAFDTAGGTVFGEIAAVLRLQGFWAEPHQLFRLPQEQLPGWGTVRFVVWGLVAAGAVYCWRAARCTAAVCSLMAVGAIALSVGAFAPALTALGYREPQKFTGLLALVFAVFAGFGAARLLAWARQRSGGWQSAATSLLAAAVLLFTPTMYWGFTGQLQPAQYPPGWFAANEYFSRQQGDFASLFLPWHQYMSFSFSERIIANPAPRFFDRAIISSNDPELGGIRPPEGQVATRVGRLVGGARPAPQLAGQLAAYNVRYVLLAKEYDYRRYDYLRGAPGFRVAGDWPAIRLYENMAWKGERQ